MNGYRVEDLVGYFAGHWSFTRDITGREGESIGRAVGVLDFSHSGGALTYREWGNLTSTAFQGPVSRVLRYLITGPGRADVFFEDGAPFHLVDLRAGAWHAEHRCGRDTYIGRYRIVDLNRWRLRWRVQGPSKDHTIATSFKRHG